MNLKNNIIYQVDAFTDKIFKGNPAGVMILEEMPNAEWMQNMAMEMNLSETAFVVPNGQEFDIRYFTPKCELPLAGHPTLASAHILYELGKVTRFKNIIFNAKESQLTIKNIDGQIVMNFPVYNLQEISIPDCFENIVGFIPLEMYISDYNWKIAVASTQEEIEQSKPNFELLNKNELGHLMVTAKSNSEKEDFVVRCFVPSLGVNEDPVTGSAHCALTPLWAKKLQKNNLKSHQISKRTGRLDLQLIKDRVIIKGKAVTVFKAELKNQ